MLISISYKQKPLIPHINNPQFTRFYICMYVYNEIMNPRHLHLKKSMYSFFP